MIDPQANGIERDVGVDKNAAHFMSAAGAHPHAPDGPQHESCRSFPQYPLLALQSLSVAFTSSQLGH